MGTEPRVQVNAGGWQLIGASGLLFGVACLLGVAAVLALSNTDTLAAVALVLAIVSFVIQIVATILGHAAARGADAEARRLNFETDKVLEEVKSNAAANQSILARQFDTLLDALIKRGPGVSGMEEEAGSEEETKRADLPAPIDFRNFTAGLSGTPSAGDIRIAKEMRSFPSEEEAAPLVHKFIALPPVAIATLDRYARNEVSSRNTGTEPGLRAVDSPANERARSILVDSGLLKKLGDGRYALTEEGRQVARFVSGRGEPPPNVAKALGIED